MRHATPTLYADVHIKPLMRRPFPTDLFRRRERALVRLADLLHADFPCRDLLFRFFRGDAVELLDPAEQQVAPSRDHVELIVGQLAPLLPHVAFELLPIACDAIPIHLDSSWWLEMYG